MTCVTIATQVSYNIPHGYGPCSPLHYQVNLSCNFFKGNFDKREYLEFVDRHWTLLSRVESTRASSATAEFDKPEEGVGEEESKKTK